MNSLRKFIERYTELSDADWKIIQLAFEKRVFEKNEIILAEGSVCKYFYFLEEGLVRYYINKDGDDITKFFTAAQYCFTSKISFTTQKPAKESIQALDKTIVWQTSLIDANKLLELKSWSTFTRKFLHDVQNQVEEMLLEATTETAEHRYEKLLERYPEIINKIPLRHLSTFLGIAPQSMSRIRKKLIN